MQRTPSWLSALAQAAGRIIGVVDSGPILPVYRPPASPTGKAEPVAFTGADRWITLAENGAAATSVWLEIDRRLPFHANPLTGAAAGAY